MGQLDRSANRHSLKSVTHLQGSCSRICWLPITLTVTSHLMWARHLFCQSSRCAYATSLLGWLTAFCFCVRVVSVSFLAFLLDKSAHRGGLPGDRHRFGCAGHRQMDRSAAYVTRSVLKLPRVSWGAGAVWVTIDRSALMVGPLKKGVPCLKLYLLKYSLQGGNW